MKAAIVLSCLWLGASQTVSFSNCCKGVFCSQKDNCPPCGSESEAGQACCEADAAGPDESGGDQAKPPCVHVEPASDFVQDDGSLKLDTPAASATFVDVELPADAVESRGHVFAPGVDPPRRPEAQIPLYLLDSILLI